MRPVQENLHVAAGNIEALQMALGQRIADDDIVHGNLDAVAADSVIDRAHFAQAGVPGADFVDIDVKCLQAGDGQPALRRGPEQSRQGQPEQHQHDEQDQQRGQQPARAASWLNCQHVPRITPRRSFR